MNVAPGTSSAAISGRLAAGQGVGAFDNTITLTYADDSSLNGASSNVGAQAVHITGNVYDHANGSTSANILTIPDVIVGYSGPVASSNSTTIGNAAGFRVNLKTTGSLTNGNTSLSTHASNVAPGTSSAAISGSLAEGQDAGTFDNVITLTYADDSSLNGASSNLGTQTFHVIGNVLGHADGSFDGAANIDELTIDFGTVVQGASVANQVFSVHNLPAGSGSSATAKLDAVAVILGGNHTILTTNLSTFTSLAPDQSTQFIAAIDTSTPGSYLAIYTLELFDEQTLLGATAGTSLQLTLTGNVVSMAQTAAIPEPSTLVLLIASLASFALAARGRRYVV